MNSIIKTCKGQIKKIVRLYGCINRKWYANYLYKCDFGRNINWKNPTEYNEKLRWMTVCSDTTLWTILSDKYKVKKYLVEKGYEDIVPKLYGCWDNVDDINFENLPNSFVLKTNHGCGGVFVVKDKSICDISVIKKGLSLAIKQRFGEIYGEFHYFGIKPLIIAEEYLPNDNKASTSIVDYKFYCFNGKPINCAIFYDRDVASHNRSGAMYDMDWNMHPEWLDPSLNYESKDMPKPVHFDYMIKLCEELSKGFPFVRLDLYEANGKVYFGEFTFTPAAMNGGSLNPDLFLEYGSMIDLSLCK